MNKLSIVTLIFFSIIIISSIVKKSLSENYDLSTAEVVEKMTNDSISPIYVKIDKVKELTKNDSGYKLVDLRSKEEFEKEHLKNAINEPLEQIVKANLLAHLDKNDKIILYDDDYALASNMAVYLQQIGYENAKYLFADYSDAKNYINGINANIPQINSQERAKYDYNKYFKQPVKQAKTKKAEATKKVVRASGGC